MLASFPHSTRQANDCHWNLWKGHCAAWGCQTPVRDNYEAMSGRDPLGHRDEMDLAASFIDSRYYTMQPRKYGTIPKVESAFQSYSTSTLFESWAVDRYRRFLKRSSGAWSKE